MSSSQPTKPASLYSTTSTTSIASTCSTSSTSTLKPLKPSSEQTQAPTSKRQALKSKAKAFFSDIGKDPAVEYDRKRWEAMSEEERKVEMETRRMEFPKGEAVMEQARWSRV